jgi:hypothetical protein
MAARHGQSPLAASGKHLKRNIAHAGKRIAGVAQHPIKGMVHSSKPFVGHGIHRVAGPAWAASMGVDAAKGMFKNPQGQWNTNVASNISQNADVAQQERQQDVLPGWAPNMGTQATRGAVQGFTHPAQTLQAAGMNAGQAAGNLASGVMKVGPAAAARGMLTGNIETAAPSPQQIQQARQSRALNQARQMPGYPQYRPGP